LKLDKEIQEILAANEKSADAVDVAHSAKSSKKNLPFIAGCFLSPLDAIEEGWQLR